MTALAARLGFSGKHDYPARIIIGFMLLIGVAAAALVALGATYASHDTRTTRTVKVEKSWGKPTTSMDGGQINAQLAGYTCDVYESRSTLVCHP